MSARPLIHHFFGQTLAAEDPPPALVESCFDTSFLAEQSRRFRRQPVDRIISVLEAVGERLADPADRYYPVLMDRMPGVARYSPAMVRESLNDLRRMLSADALRKRLACLGDYHCLDTYVHLSGGRVSRAVPLGAVCHIAAGNIFLGAVDSLVYGLITKNVNVLKCSGQDLVFPCVFFDALADLDRDHVCYPFTALTYWAADNRFVIDRVKKSFDAILLFGGEEAVLEYKQNLPAKTQILSYGPKISFGVVARGLDERQCRAAAQGFARDIVLWEQRACTSCQNIFIEGSGEAFAAQLAAALEKLAGRYPQDAVTLDEAVEIRKVRELARWQAHNGRAQVWEGRQAHHTVVLQNGADLVPSPLNRTVYVNRVESLKDLLRGNLRDLAYYMSTAGVAAPENEIQAIIEDLQTLGLMRFCRPGSMGLVEDPEGPHDGAWLPRQLVRMINRENLPTDLFGFSRAAEPARDDLLLARLNACLKNAFQSPFYREHLSGRALPLRSLDDFRNWPVLEKRHLADHGFQRGTAMLTRPDEGCYVFSAGGTTSKLYYVCYDSPEFLESARYWGRGFRNAGIGPRDVVANLMRAGALWTGFPATNLGLQETGCRILSLSANQSDSETLCYLRRLNPTVLLGLPTILYQLAQAAEAENWDSPVAKIFYAGEHLNPLARAYLQKVFAPGVISSMGYAAVETGPIAHVCPHCRGTEHHVFEDYCYVELDENGEVLVTTLRRSLHPFIRFRVGDLAEWVETPCACGRSGRRLRLLARNSDYLRLNYEDLTVNEVASALARFPELSGFFQICAAPLPDRTLVDFRVETQNAGPWPRDPRLAEQALQSIYQTCQWFKNPRCQAYSVNNQVQFKLTLLPPQTLPRVGRTGKIRRIVDERAPQ